MKQKKYQKEKGLPNQIEGISTEEMNVLLELIKTHTCKIICKDGKYATGCFCNIQYNWNSTLKVLMTSNHVLDIDDIQQGQYIIFTIDNDKEKYKILIDNTRKTYTNKSYDVTIIEIKKNEINEKSFFDLDEQIFLDNSSDIFINSQIFLLHYPKGKKMEISPGIIQNISEDKGCKIIQHLCQTTGGSSGGPIINKKTFRVIGIHIGAPEEEEKAYNIGTLLKEL